MHELVSPRQRQRPAAQSIAPQHSELALHGAPAPVQHRSVPRRVAQWSPAQQASSLVHTVVLPGAMQVELAARQAPALHVSPGQQSFPSQGRPAVRHTHQRPDAVPDTSQDILPQQVFAPAPASATPASPPLVAPQDCPAEVQQRRAPVDVAEHERLPQQSELTAHPVEPKDPHVGGAVIASQRPLAQRDPAQHSVSSTQADPVR